jgi:hypothetical protein
LLIIKKKKGRLASIEILMTLRYNYVVVGEEGSGWEEGKEKRGSGSF